MIDQGDIDRAVEWVKDISMGAKIYIPEEYCNLILKILKEYPGLRSFQDTLLVSDNPVSDINNMVKENQSLRQRLKEVEDKVEKYEKGIKNLDKVYKWINSLRGKPMLEALEKWEKAHGL